MADTALPPVLRRITEPSAQALTLALGGKFVNGLGKACCPAHDDHKPSLEIAERNGRTVFVCRAGCEQAAVLAALKSRGLWPSGQAAREEATPRRPQRVGEPLLYIAEDGTALRKLRWEPGFDGGRKSYSWKHLAAGGWQRGRGGHRPLLYGHEDIDAADAGEPILVVESERSRDLLSRAGWLCVATGGSGDWRSEFAGAFNGHRVVLLPDNDAPGSKWAAAIRRDLPGAVVVNLPGLRHKQGPDHWPQISDKAALMSVIDAQQDTPATRRAQAHAQPAPEPEAVDSDPEEPAASMWLPDAFWNARPYLSELRAWCLSRGYPPDPTLCSALSRYAAFLPRGTTMDTGLFSPQASLNLTVGIISRPGEAKSEAMDAARTVVPRPECAYEGGVGTGEGLADAYMGVVAEGTGETLRGGKEKTQSVRKQVRWNAFLHLDEGNTLKKFDQRKGATILENIRTAWTGKPLGATVASEDRKRNVEGYNLGVAIGWQPETASWLLADATSGTPQRFLFTRCNPKQRPEEGKAVTAQPWELPPAPMHVTFCGRARQDIGDDYYSEAHSADPYAPRVMLMRAKVAALFACIEFTQLVTEEHWEMARMVVETSTAVRKWVQGEATEAEEAAVERRMSEAAARAEAVAAASRNAEVNAQRDEATVLRYLTKHPGSTSRDVRANAFKGPRRQLVQATLDRMIAALKVRDDDGKLWIA